MDSLRASFICDERVEFLLKWADLPLRVTRIDHVGGTAWAVSRGASRSSTLEELNIHPMIAKAMIEIGKMKGGLVATVGSSRQGKTTTSAAMFVAWHSVFGGNGLTVEQPPEIPMHGPHGQNGYIYQCEVLPTASEVEREAEIAKHLRRALRSGIDRIFMGETRSPSEAAVALDAATTNHLVLANFHA
ncbi:ATPase, T2SS/T4P/T4SS family, partial [Niveispirillum sp. SYP-B3756]|uniref:ATPase, T2SS/T4P/T4SS family n=1 Tax=Niveispirillum sp. SYP-B3756 TaxID=2662178 RepID=UPI0015667E91